MMKNVLMGCALAAVTLVAATSCDPKPTVEARGPIAKNIVYIGLDGWGGYSLPKADMPVTKSLMEQGCWTLQKRTVLPSSSGANWASMFMGACPELHGFNDCCSSEPNLPPRVKLKNNIFPTIFQIYRDANPDAEIGVLYEWGTIKYFVDTLSVNYFAQAPDCAEHPENLSKMAADYIKAKHPSLLAVVWDNPDHVGHGAGHDTPEYYEVIHRLDACIGEVVDAVREAGMLDETVFIITSDHGGIEKGHGGITMQEMETPFIIAGKGIKKGGEFTESMMQCDVGSTMAYIFALNQPQVWIGRPMLQVFE